jgi:glycine/D-amino acid oxidase-like deaminating enzyme
MVPRAHQHDEMATDAYWGGAVIPDNGCLHPGLYHKGLLDRAIDAGAHVFGRTEVIKLIDLGDKGHKLQTNRGTLRARQVIIATNGYTPKSLNWYSRRLIPFRAFMAATEELPEDLMTKLIPNRRTIIDSNANIDFFRPAPDSRRIIFGGATTEKLDGPEAIAKRMKQILGRILPDARDVRLSHVWDGYCAATFDMMPHLGSRGTIHHAVGYNFAGITTGTVFGRLLAQRILGQASNGSVFDNGSFPTIPFYSGTPWFLGLVMRYFAWHDQQIARKAANS